MRSEGTDQQEEKTHRAVPLGRLLHRGRVRVHLQGQGAQLSIRAATIALDIKRQSGELSFLERKACLLVLGRGQLDAEQLRRGTRAAAQEEKMATERMEGG
jgi:hypothetical protein